jgi:hypothetical protein
LIKTITEIRKWADEKKWLECIYFKKRLPFLIYEAVGYKVILVTTWQSTVTS